jgi:chromosome segregation ATPase
MVLLTVFSWLLDSVPCATFSAAQHKELEVRLKELEKAKEASATRADQLGQDILRLDEAVTAAEERRKGLRKQLAQVRPAAC